MSVRNRRGATLPLTILVISVLGVSVAISYARLSSERRISGDGQAQLDAFQVAQSVLAGGYVRSNGNNTASGAVITGLNVELGQTVGASDMNGNKDFQYDSCALTRALGHIGSLQRVRNGWIDTWPSY